MDGGGDASGEGVRRGVETGEGAFLAGGDEGAELGAVELVASGLAWAALSASVVACACDRVTTSSSLTSAGWARPR